MPDLEKQIAEWRDTLSTQHLERETLDELESHLRDHIERLVQEGMSEAEAFETAATQLGQGETLAAEFQKLEQHAWLPIKVAAGIGILIAALLAIALLVSINSDRSGILLASHVFCVTLGYTATFLLGLLGVCYVAQRSYAELSPGKLRIIPVMTFRLGSAGAALTAVGILLGTLWSKGKWGHYWSWDAKETGALFILGWQMLYLGAHRFSRITGRSLLTLGLLGNVVVSLGWFGANNFSATHSYGTGNQLTFLTGLIIAHLTLFLLSLAPAGWLQLRKQEGQES